MKALALQYLKEKPLLYADMIECIEKGDAEIFHASEKGVFLRDLPSDIYMHAGQEEILTIPAAQIARKSGWLVSHGESSAQAVRRRYPNSEDFSCYHVVYEKKEKVPVVSNLIFQTANETHLPQIVRSYDKETPETLKSLQEKGKIICAFDPSDGGMVGFIGRHPEGSMGLLLIFPEFRRHGFAYALEGELVNRILDEGRLPYAHIVVGNDKSLALQKKLGFTVAEERIAWHSLKRIKPQQV